MNLNATEQALAHASKLAGQYNVQATLDKGMVCFDGYVFLSRAPINEAQSNEMPITAGWMIEVELMDTEKEAPNNYRKIKVGEYKSFWEALHECVSLVIKNEIQTSIENYKAYHAIES